MRSLAGNIELFGNTLLHKMHRAPGTISSPIYVNPRVKQGSLVFRFILRSAVLELPILDYDVNPWDSLTMWITPIRHVVVLDCWFKVRLFEKLSVIHKEKINFGVTVCYFTDTAVANEHIHFTSLVLMLKLYEVQINWTGDPWWCK